MAAIIMPEASYLREAFDYNPYQTGILTWRMRPRAQFRSDRAWKTTNSSWAGKPFGHIIVMKSNVTYMRGRIGEREVLAHRIIWKWMTGEEPKHEIDHWDGDGLNNRWPNLREATHQANQYNMKNRENTICPRGVYRIHNHFAASIHFKGKRHNLGTRKTMEEAHQLYLDASKRLHEEFSFLNRKTTD